MSVNGISSTHGAMAIDGTEFEPTSRAEVDHGPTTYTAHEARPVEKPFDLFEALGGLFSGTAKDGNAFDLGAILASIFDFAGEQAAKNGDLKKDQHQVGVQERVEVSGETGDDHFKAKGRAAAEAHALARSQSETFIDENGAGVRGSAEASVGASAEAEGSITTDLGSIDGRARASAEAYARVAGEAKAGPKGAEASGKAETGVMASADASSNAQLAEGLVTGHAEARAQAGAGGKATGKVGISYDPPEAILTARAESFAGARAGYSAKGGVAGYSYGIEGEVWAGVGAKAEVNGGLDSDGKFKLEFSLGIACGVGAMLKVNIEFDTKQFAKTVGDLVGGLGKVVGGVFGAVAGLFGGGKGDGSHAAQLIEQAANQAAPLIAQAASDEVEPQHEEHEWRSEEGTSHSKRGTLAEGTLS